MKKTSSYKMRVPVEELLQHPDACLVRDILSQTGSTILIPSKVPISKFIEGLDDPRRIIEALRRMNIRTVDVELANDLDNEEVMTRLRELDPSVSVIDNEVTQHAQYVMDDIFKNATLDEKYSIPKDEVENLGQSISHELSKVSQIAISLISSDEGSYIQNHALNVSLLAGYIAKKLADGKKCKPEIIDKTILAGLLFDIGKTAIPPELLNKKGELAPKDLKILKTHVEASVKKCREAGIDDMDILEGIGSHHEKFDGSGYPKGLVGSQIPLIGRILAVADTFDAMTSSRIYKDAVSSKLSFNFIMSANETYFDPDICKIFISGMGVYPPGSTVELSNGKVATVVAMTAGNLLQPKVALMEDEGSSVIDLAAEKLYIKRSLDADPKDELDMESI